MAGYRHVGLSRQRPPLAEDSRYEPLHPGRARSTVLRPTQVREIVDNILLFQRANGGWPKDYDMLAVLTDEQRKAVRATHERADTSFDNHNLHSQVDYLAQAYHISGEETGGRRLSAGLDFMLCRPAAQRRISAELSQSRKDFRPTSRSTTA